MHSNPRPPDYKEDAPHVTCSKQLHAVAGQAVPLHRQPVGCESVAGQCSECCIRLQVGAPTYPEFGIAAENREVASPRSFEPAILSMKTRTSFLDVLIPPDGDLQLPRNILKRGDRMGTSDFRVVQLIDPASAFHSVAPVHHGCDGDSPIQLNRWFSSRNTCSSTSVHAARLL